MGNSCSHTTKQQVTDTLESQLLSAAQTQYIRDFNGQALPKGSGLQDYTEAIAKANFKKKFAYDWDSVSSNCKPPHLEPTNPRVFPASDFCIIDADHDLSKGIADYVKTGLASANLESWIKDKATSDLSAIIGQDANYPCDNEWHYGSGSETYDSTNPKIDSYQFDVSLIYTNATRTESAIDVTLHILYFVGVYYTVDSPAAKTFSQLQSNAYAAAKTLPNVSQKSVINDVDLANALSQYDAPIFKQNWGYDYDNGKPSDFATDETEPVFTKNQHLAYMNTRTLTAAQVEEYVKLHIMDGLQIPIETIADEVKTEIQSQFQQVLQTSDSGGWKYLPINKEYGLHQSSQRPIKINALLTYYSKSATITVVGKEVTVDMIYIYFFGLVYELEADPIVQDMTRVICQNIPGISQGAIPKHIRPEDLTGFVETFNVSKFDKEYGFHFPDDDTKITQKVKYWRAFFEFNTYNPSVADIKDKVEKQIFGPDATEDEEIKHDLQKTVYNWIVDHFADFSGTSYAKDDNEWYNHVKKNNFTYKGKNDTTWELGAKTSWAYANATITEDGRGGETLQYFYLSFLMYITAEQDDDSDDDV